MFDITKLVPFLESYPIWVRLLFAFWILASAVLLVALFLGSHPEATTDAPDTTSDVPANHSPDDTSEPHDQPKASQITAAEYSAELDRLEDRFLEREEYIASLEGSRVEWEGQGVHDAEESPAVPS